MMSGVGVGISRCIHWTGVMGTGFGGGLSGVRVAGTMVTLGDNAGGVSVSTPKMLRDNLFGARLQVRVTVLSK